MKKYIIIIASIILIGLTAFFILMPTAEDYNKKADLLYNQKKYIEALDLYEKAAEKESSHAYYRIGELYLLGLGIEKSEEKAIKYLTKAAEKDQTEAQNLLGRYYFDRKEFDKSYQQFSKAVIKGNSESEYYLGLQYQFGLGTEQNYEKAFKLYEKASVYNNDAKFRLGYLYINGTGTEQNYEKAFKLFTLTANSGITESYNVLGYLYDHGYGVEENVEEACIWFRKGANSNDSEAQYNLANKLWKGDGIVKNREEALYWFQKAAEQGHERAIKFINDFNRWKESVERKEEEERRRKEKGKPRICPGCNGTGRVLAGTGKWENCGLCRGSGIYRSFENQWSDMIDAIDGLFGY